MTGQVHVWTVCAVLVLGSGADAIAQQRPAGPPQGRGGESDGLTVAELERSFDSYEIFEAQKALALDDQQFLVVGQRIRRLQGVRRRFQNQRRQILGQLRQALAGGALVDEAGVLAQVQRLDELGLQQAREVRRAQQALDVILTPRQRVQFRIFQERFERQKLDLLARARQARGGR